MVSNVAHTPHAEPLEANPADIGRLRFDLVELAQSISEQASKKKGDEAYLQEVERCIAAPMAQKTAKGQTAYVHPIRSR